MKNFRLILITLVASGLITTALVSCKKSNPAFSLTGAAAGAVNINGGSTATGVDPKSNIILTFSDNIDATTATSANITLVRTNDNANIPITITVSSATLTIDHATDFGPGTEYSLNLSAGLKSTAGEALVALTRTFSTAGAFVPSDYVAYWNFNGNANDATGTFNSSSSTDVTYVTGRNANAGQAAKFNGTTSLIQVPDAPTLENTASFSLSFWVNVDTVGHVQTGGGGKGYFVMGAGVFKGFQFEIDGGNGSTIGNCKLAAQYNLGATTGSQDLWCDATGNLGWQGWTFSKDLSGQGGLKVLLAGVWANIVCTYDAPTKIGSVFINGVLMKSQDFNLWPAGDPFTGCLGLEFDPLATDVGHNFVFGFAEDPTSTLGVSDGWGNYASPDANHYQGLIDDVAIYHRTLTTAEIGSIYSSGK